MSSPPNMSLQMTTATTHIPYCYTDPLCSDHISHLVVEITLNALRSHPSDGDLLLIPRPSLSSSSMVVSVVVLGGIHVFCESKISNLDNSISIYPVGEIEGSYVHVARQPVVNRMISALTCNFLLPGHGEQTYTWPDKPFLWQSGEPFPDKTF